MNQESTRAPQSNGELRPPTDLRLPSSDFRPLPSGPHPDNRQLTADNRGKALRAFTLIELLVVVTIIIILIGLLFPVFNGVQNQAKKVQAKNDLTQLVTAVNAFYTEYGQYPLPSGTTKAGYTYGGKGDSSDATNDQLLNELRGVVNTGINTKQIAFMNPPVAKDPNNPRSGIGQNDGIYYDPWGTPYKVRLDSNYSNSIPTNPPYQNAPTWNSINMGVIAWSYGKDAQLGASGNGDATASGFDDVLSWQ